MKMFIWCDVLDEVFGSENFCFNHSFKKTSGQDDLLPQPIDLHDLVCKEQRSGEVSPSFIESKSYARRIGESMIVSNYQMARGEN